MKSTTDSPCKHSLSASLPEGSFRNTAVLPSLLCLKPFPSFIMKTKGLPQTLSLYSLCPICSHPRSHIFGSSHPKCLQDPDQVIMAAPITAHAGLLAQMLPVPRPSSHLSRFNSSIHSSGKPSLKALSPVLKPGLHLPSNQTSPSLLPHSILNIHYYSKSQ